MVRNCCIVGCHASKGRCRGLSFHGIKRSNNLTWQNNLIKIVNRIDKNFNIEAATICSRHFDDDCFKINESTGKRSLISNSLPTRYLPHTSLETRQIAQRRSPVKEKLTMASKKKEVKPKKAVEEVEESEEEEEEDEENEEGEDEEGEEEEEGNEGDQGQTKEQTSFTYRCVICDEKFETDSDFHKHRIHHDRCPQCSELFLCHKELIIHLSLHAVEGNICLFCRKISHTKESFEAHLKAHRQHFKTLDCQTCGMKLLTSEEFKIHICVKRGATTNSVGKADKRPVAAPAADATPTKRIKVEAEDGDYERVADCSDVKMENLEDEDVVNKKMSAGGDLDVKTEAEDDKPFKCGYCAEPYGSSEQLCVHMTQIHPDKLT